MFHIFSSELFPAKTAFMRMQKIIVVTTKLRQMKILTCERILSPSVPSSQCGSSPPTLSSEPENVSPEFSVRTYKPDD